MSGGRVGATAGRLRDETGSVALWMLGLSVALLFLGGISVDLWRSMAIRRDLAGRVDAAAVAAAAAVDETHFRATGQVRLDASLAREAVLRSFEAGTAGLRAVDVRVPPDGTAVTVRAVQDVDLTLMRVLLLGEELTVSVTATSGPRVGQP